MSVGVCTVRAPAGTNQNFNSGGRFRLGLGSSWAGCARIEHGCFGARHPREYRRGGRVLRRVAQTATVLTAIASSPRASYAVAAPVTRSCLSRMRRDAQRPSLRAENLPACPRTFAGDRPRARGERAIARSSSSRRPVPGEGGHAPGGPTLRRRHPVRHPHPQNPRESRAKRVGLARSARRGSGSGGRAFLPA